MNSTDGVMRKLQALYRRIADLYDTKNNTDNREDQSAIDGMIIKTQQEIETLKEGPA